MKMDYQAPEVELISLVAEEMITDDNADGDQDVVSNPGIIKPPSAT